MALDIYERTNITEGGPHCTSLNLRFVSELLLKGLKGLRRGAAAHRLYHDALRLPILLRFFQGSLPHHLRSGLVRGGHYVYGIYCHIKEWETMFEILRCWGSAFSDQPLCDLHGWILEQPFGTPAAICTPIQKAWRMWHPVHPSTFPNCKGVYIYIYIYYIMYTYYYIGYWEMDGNETLQDKNHQQHCKWNLLHSLAAVFCDRPRYRMCFLQIAKAKSLVLPRPNKVDLKKKRRRSFQQRNHFCVPPFFGRIVGLKLTQVQWGIWMLEIEVLVQLRQVPLPEFHPWGPLGTGKSQGEKRNFASRFSWTRNAYDSAELPTKNWRLTNDCHVYLVSLFSSCGK